MPRAWVQFLARELGSHNQHSMAKKKKEEEENTRKEHYITYFPMIHTCLMIYITHTGEESKKQKRAGAVLVSYCWYAFLQTKWLTMTQMHSLTVLKSEGQQQSHWTKVKVSSGLTPSGGSSREPCPLLCLPSSGCQHSLAHNPFLCLWKQNVTFASPFLTLLPRSHRFF